ncbi:hypothetical protein ACFYTS_22425 [Nocardia sp. NPDC004151]|uniref:hypothetical protein n=1 Tax=Nocardia sp. NPDC004151 TaxID=3364304 RepID=UPI0036C726B9
MEYEFADWLGDALVESSPCFIVTQDLSQRIEQEGLTGVCFDDVLVSVSAKGEELIDTELPPWRWMKAIGRPGESDFGVTRGLCLVVSDRALDLLNDAGTANADVTEFRTSQ